MTINDFNLTTRERGTARDGENGPYKHEITPRDDLIYTRLRETYIEKFHILEFTITI